MNAAAAWGKLAAEILTPKENWDMPMEELNKVKELINDKVSYPPPSSLISRHMEILPSNYTIELG